MKTFILASVVLAAALAASIKEEEIFGPKRKNKSAPARPNGSKPASAPALLYAPVSQRNDHAQAQASSPIAFYLPPAGNMPSALHYRKNQHSRESMMFSDHEEHPQAHSYGGYGPAAGAIASGAVQAAASRPAMGLFPNANIGGCAIPLLVSCAPSISKGQIMKSQHASYSAPSYGYKNVDFNTQMRLHEDAMHKAVKQQAHWGQMDHAAAATGIGHMHQPISVVHASHSPSNIHGNHMNFLSHHAHVNSPTSKIQGHHG